MTYTVLAPYTKMIDGEDSCDFSATFIEGLLTIVVIFVIKHLPSLVCCVLLLCALGQAFILIKSL